MSNSKITRRGLLGGAAVGGVATFAGPWKHNRVWAQSTDKPIRIGITSDASGQYANSGASDRRGMLMAIEEANARGGALGRKNRVHAYRHRNHTGHRLAGRRAADQP
ncbi:ABC transporter substrate-binding protein [Roseibium salinum]|nr:ABC transporter substrate-binding protein [Roseibium salinum]